MIFFYSDNRKVRTSHRARFGSTYTKIGMIQRRLAWPLRKDDMQICKGFHIFCGRRRGWDVSREQHRNMYII